MEALRPWPKLQEQDRWLTALFDDLLAGDDAADAEQLLARAQQLREEVGEAPADGDREAALALAERYERAAVARSPSR